MRAYSNLIANPAFDEGRDTPRAWQWVVLAGHPGWNFDHQHKVLGRRSIRIHQDGKDEHGQFRQIVPCRGGQRYRLTGRIRLAVEGTGYQSGANLYLISLQCGRPVHDNWYRPFLVGLQEWTLWSMEYQAAPGADHLQVSFDMRFSCGLTWFDALELRAVDEPLVSSAPLAASPPRCEARPRAGSVMVVGVPEHDYLMRGVIAPLFGKREVIARDVLPDRPETEAILIGRAPATKARFPALAALAERTLVVMAPQALAASVPAVTCRTFRTRGVEPCARIVAANALVRGFSPGDVLPWHDRCPDGGFEQTQLRIAPDVMDRLGLRPLAVSATREKAGNGHPLILWRAGARGGGLAVMDWPGLSAPPDYKGYGNLTAMILANAFGRPQTSFGRFVYPGHPSFGIERFYAELHALAAAQPALRLAEEGRTRQGRPVLSLSLGPPDAPTVYLDCGIHGDEWSPCFGTVLYLQRLAEEYAHGRPWARALLRSLQVKAIPVLSPDGWEDHVRCVRSIDLNRNFPVFRKNASRAYRGPAALSEPETRLVARIFRRDRVVAALNWHETSAATNWVGFPASTGRYRKYAVSVPALFAQVIDGRYFCHRAATWTQITDSRNYHFYLGDSFPYLRDYSPTPSPYEMFFADRLGIEALTIEQYGSSDLSCAQTPQRTDITGQIIEMLLGLQVGLLCRNHGSAPLHLDVPLAADGAAGVARVFGPDGRERRCVALQPRGGRTDVRATLQPQDVLLAELNPPPWQRTLRERTHAP